MTSFVNALRSEWTKMASLRSTWIFVILLVGSMFGPVVLMSTLAETGTTLDWKLLTIGSMIFAMIGIAYAGSALAGEYNDQMQAHAFLTQDRRSLWLVARGLLQMVLLFVAWGVGVGIAFLVTLVAPNIAFEGGSGQDAVSSILTFAVFSVIAMALGVLTRSRVAAVAIPLVWLLVVEKLIELATIVSKVAVPFWLAAPMARINQLAGQLTGNSDGWPGPGMGLEVSTAAGPVMPGAPAGEGVSQFAAGTIQPLWFNVSVLVAWVAVAIAVSLWVNAKRDVK